MQPHSLSEHARFAIVLSVLVIIVAVVTIAINWPHPQPTTPSPTTAIDSRTQAIQNIVAELRATATPVSTADINKTVTTLKKVPQASEAEKEAVISQLQNR